jgi:hypothetical protein
MKGMNAIGIGGAVRRAGPALGIAAASYAVVLCAVEFIHRRGAIPYGDLTRDPTIILHGQLTSGALSMLGGLTWALGCGASLVAAVAAPEGRRFFAATAAFTAFLMVDDVFLLHDKLFPKYLGVPERVLHVAYPLIAVAWAAGFRRRIFASPWPSAVAGFALLGLSQGLDVLGDGREPDWWFLAEDGAKFAGIVHWSIYQITAAAAAFRPPLPR